MVEKASVFWKGASPSNTLSLYPEHVQVVIAKDAGIKSINDLKGNA